MTGRERLTKNWGDNCVATKLNYDFLLSLPNIEVKNFNAIIQKLANYEDLEEQGKIIVPPCNVGDTVYMPWEWNGTKGVAILTVTHIITDYLHSYIKAPLYSDDEEYSHTYGNGRFSFDDFGKTVFLTPEEAEKALAEREVNE